MLPAKPARESPNFTILNSLFTLSESPLPRPPGYSASHSPNCLGSSSEGCSAGSPVRNPESYLVCYSVSYLAGYPERNSASCSESSGDRRSADCSAECPANCSRSSSHSSLPSSGAVSLLSYTESCSAECPGKWGLYRAARFYGAPGTFGRRSVGLSPFSRGLPRRNPFSTPDSLLSTPAILTSSPRPCG